VAAVTREPEGYALVEAVVALGIVAFVLGALFQTLSMARGTIAAAEARRDAMLQARSLTAQLGSSLPLVTGSSDGRSEGLRWRVEIDPVESREIQAQLQRAVVTVSDERGRPLARLETMRLAR
jgi:type II secretory pathway pseudopilin PulG